ncbi:uncharacterized protein MONBRDRAFT_32644 [Monosiga brevicollis MX1]|uniref:Sec1 family domain-containing protein 1 n=1 Tax=Monosiga brevicollis TaxID=81824 RepID=A9V0V8_MONBE|nr:uncharacterized protein MONBRDRAFT_32644 [Monosiga brevicollis MX1]EDQ88702.1 predicted protein [Monosiga brevicollis MX1]|eukprot:XP_001746315.1 hypothetical protein [Monosiga brevicollis MX1]
MASMQAAQREALEAMLGATPAARRARSFMPDWKVLIYDRIGMKILAPLLNVSELRDLGVTLHVSIEASREPIHDVPAVYFVMPTEANIKRICRDCIERRYASYQINFITTVPRPLLEELASTTAEAGVAADVHRVYDMYSNFVALEDEFFSLCPSEPDALSYGSLNAEGASEHQLMSAMNEMVDGLFSVFVTLGVVPIIRCSPKNAAFQIADRLNSKFRDQLKNSRSTMFQDRMSATGSFQRPVLVLLDRQLDMATVLHHTWTYQALVHDILGLESNKVTIMEKAKQEGQSPKRRDIVLDKDDRFWQRYKGEPFPVVASAIEEELQECTRKEKEIKNLGSAASTGAEAEADSGDQTSKITAAVNSLPELLKQRSMLNSHMSLLTSIMDNLSSRKLDEYFQTEEEVMNKKTVSIPVLDMLKNPEAGTLEDRLRLYIIYLLDGDASEKEREACEAVLAEQGCDLSSLKFLNQLKELLHMQHQPTVLASHSSGGLFSFSKTLSQGASFLQGVKSLMPTSGDLPLTRIVDALMENRTSELVADYPYFDPKRGTTELPRHRAPFDQALVFVVGGGNYTEFQNLQDYCKRHKERNIIYGVSQLVRPTEHLDQLSQLGKNMGGGASSA